jgi:hypothetical protein
MKAFSSFIMQYSLTFLFLFSITVFGAARVSAQQPPKFAEIYNPAEATVLYMFDNSWSEEDITAQRFNGFAAAPSSLGLEKTDFVGAIVPKKIACFVLKTQDLNAINTVEQKLKQQYPTANFRTAPIAELDAFVELAGPGFKYNN